MLYRRSETRLERDGYSRWIDSPERLIEREFLRRMSASGAFRTVFSEGNLRERDLLLEGVLLALEATPEGMAFLQLSVEVRRAGNDEDVLTEVYRTSAPMSGKTPEAFAAAASEALGALIDDVAGDILDGLPKN